MSSPPWCVPARLPGVLPKALILDLDGTLVDSEAYHTESIVRALRGVGLELDEEESAYIVGHAWQGIYEHLRVHERTGMTFERLYSAAIEAKKGMDEEGMRIDALEGVAQLIELCRALDITVVIVSGSSRLEIQHALEVLPSIVGETLRFYMGAEDYERGKPAPDGFAGACERLGLEPSECLVFEDSEAGIGAARAAGMRVVATTAAAREVGTPGYQDPSSADRVIASLLEVDRDFLESVMG